MRKGGPTSSTRLRSARSRLSLFREFGPCRCKQRPGIQRPLGLAAAVVGLRAVRLREFIKAVCIDLVHDRGIRKAAPLQLLGHGSIPVKGLTDVFGVMMVEIVVPGYDDYHPRFSA